jgi:IMP dehydrogenase
MKISEGLTFDDVLLVPKFSSVKTRSSIDLSVKFNDFTFSNPIIPANMKTITGKKMAKLIADAGGLAIVHRFMSLEEQLDIVNEFVLASVEGTVYYPHHIGYSVGVKEENRNDIDALVSIGAEILCIDIAHGDSQACLDTIDYIKGKFPEVLLIAGNVATGEGARRLWRAGADVVKVGVGPGSLCTTRIETGNGTPQLSALMDVADMRADLELADFYAKGSIEGKGRKFYFIADGGIKSAGDVVKALCFADMVMVGNLFAGCDETPGSIRYIDGVPHKEYAGSSTHKTNRIEGVSTVVPVRGPTADMLIRLKEGLQSGCSYQGAHNLQELKNNPAFVRITNAGLKESHPHSVIIK